MRDLYETFVLASGSGGLLYRACISRSTGLGGMFDGGFVAGRRGHSLLAQQTAKLFLLMA